MKEAKTALQSASFTEAALEGDDSRVTFYTGVPSFFMLLGIFNLVKDYISHLARHSLTQFEEMVVVFYADKARVPNARPCFQIQRISVHDLPHL